MSSLPVTNLGRSAESRTTVGVADMAIGTGPTGEIVTYALGSCIGVTIFDPKTHVGGMLHFMLPSSKTNPDKAAATPAMFADTGIPALFRECYKLGADKNRLIVCAAGGAEVITDDGHFKIGSRNRTVLRKLFWKNNILIKAEETGGNISRTLTLNLADGTVTIRNKGKVTTLWQM